MTELSLLLRRSKPVIAIPTVMAQMVDRVRGKVTGINYGASQAVIVLEVFSFLFFTSCVPEKTKAVLSSVRLKKHFLLLLTLKRLNGIVESKTRGVNKRPVGHIRPSSWFNLDKSLREKNIRKLGKKASFWPILVTIEFPHKGIKTSKSYLGGTRNISSVKGV